MGSMAGKWYKCPHCWNYSTIPLECCGERMIEEEGDEPSDTNYLVEDDNETKTEYY